MVTPTFLFTVLLVAALAAVGLQLRSAQRSAF
ncbi:hypothetical protein SAMN06265337_1638 [Hymenobacter gelipurpurascens]|uniref:Uncharacterized protein n=1 Tax=Hymenobacter gelipurpurascens TaxID=89968 RepID=A0A212TKU7_9BACT|nr:hypothetical protein SAMN06265337_1638 [Hymenobacter gelipurpurascens]